MSEGIVDVFETIQIQKEYRDLFGVPGSQSDGLIHTVIEEHAIGQTSQKVVLRGMGHLQGHSPGGAHVAKNDYRSRGDSFPVVDGGDGVLNRNFKSVAPDEDTVCRQ